jgi:hypothetical protein
LLDLPEFAKNEGKSLKKSIGKQVKAKPTKAKKNSSMTETKQVKKPHHQVTSKMVQKESEKDMWDDMVDAVAGDQDFMQQTLAESNSVDIVNKPKHKKKAKSKHGHKSRWDLT